MKPRTMAEWVELVGLLQSAAGGKQTTPAPVPSCPPATPSAAPPAQATGNRERVKSWLLRISMACFCLAMAVHSVPWSGFLAVGAALGWFGWFYMDQADDRARDRQMANAELLKELRRYNNETLAAAAAAMSRAAAAAEPARPTHSRSCHERSCHDARCSAVGRHPCHDLDCAEQHAK